MPPVNENWIRATYGSLPRRLQPPEYKRYLQPTAAPTRATTNTPAPPTTFEPNPPPPGSPPGTGQPEDFLQYLNRPEFFPDQTFVPFSPQTEQALEATQARALAGSPLQTEAQQQTFDTMRGGYIGANPHLDSMFDQSVRGLNRNYGQTILPGANAAFSMANRSGSPAHQQTVKNIAAEYGDILSGHASQFYGNAYEPERARMFNAMQLAPGMAALDYSDPAHLAMVGGAREAQASLALNDAMQRYDYNQMRDIRDLSTYSQLLQGVGGNFGTTTGTTSGIPASFANPAAGLGGGLLAGVGLAGQTGLLGGLFGGGSAAAGGLAGGAAAAGGGLAAGGLGSAAASALPAAALAFSNRRYKENERPVEHILPRIRTLKVAAWDYKPEYGGGTHVGPYAEDFKAAFGVGDGDVIHMADGLGVCLLAIKELDRRTAHLAC